MSERPFICNVTNYLGMTTWKALNATEVPIARNRCKISQKWPVTSWSYQTWLKFRTPKNHPEKGPSFLGGVVWGPKNIEAMNQYPMLWAHPSMRPTWRSPRKLPICNHNPYQDHQVLPSSLIICNYIHSTYHKIIFWCVRKYLDLWWSLSLDSKKNNTTGSTTSLDHWIIVAMATSREVVTASHVGVQGVGAGRTPTDLADPKDVVRPGDTGSGALGNQDEWNGGWNPYTVHLSIYIYI